MKSGLIKRYFDMPDNKAVAELDIIPSSPAAVATEKDFTEICKTTMREVSAEEYIRLARKYESGASYEN